MFGEIVLRCVVSDVVIGPPGERIDLDNRSHEVVVHERSRPAAWGVGATEPGHHAVVFSAAISCEHRWVFSGEGGDIEIESIVAKASRAAQALRPLRL